MATLIINPDMAKDLAKHSYPQFDSHQFKESQFNDSEKTSIHDQVCLNILWTFKDELYGLNYDIPILENILNNIPDRFKNDFKHIEEVNDSWYIWFYLYCEY
tara:strand:- start:72 stop:377 length:306 start_codon:yes stop_codon:yes gene_type:complete